MERETALQSATQCTERLEPDVILLDVSDQAWDPAAALMRFFRNRLDIRVIGVNLGDNSISIGCEVHLLMLGVEGQLRVIQEAANAACSECRAKEVDDRGTQDERKCGR